MRYHQLQGCKMAPNPRRPILGTVEYYMQNISTWCVYLLAHGKFELKLDISKYRADFDDWWLKYALEYQPTSLVRSQYWLS